MFAPISAIFALLFFSSTLPNGIRLVELPASGDKIEIVAGYTAGGLKGFTDTEAARRLMYAVYAAGGTIERLEELDRTGIRISETPAWALPMLIPHLTGLFAEVPKADEEPLSSSPGFRAKIEEEIRNALLGPGNEASAYATDDGFILISAPAPKALLEQLGGIPRRASGRKTTAGLERLEAERTLRFKSDLPAGGLIFASPIPGVHYRQWYSILLLDRLIRRVVSLPLRTDIPLTIRPYYYRIELAIPPGQFPEPVEENLLQELQRLQFTPPSFQDLVAARQEALSYLDSSPVREWFLSHDLALSREEGLQWIRAMMPDDMRIAARDLLIMNRVIATWAPRVRQSSLSIERLGDPDQKTNSNSETRNSNLPSVPDLPPVYDRPPVFPPHTDASMSRALPERLSSGVSLVASNMDAVFAAGMSFIQESDATRYPSGRILVLTTGASMDSARLRWSAFQGSKESEGAVPRGPVSSGDLGALFVLKTLLDLKIIQAGWWYEAELHINAGEGSALQIRADSAKRAQILDWIQRIVSEKPSDSDFLFVREVALHRYDTIRPHLQALIWERDPQGIPEDIETISAAHVQDVARIYF